MSVRRFLLPVSSSASAEAALHSGLMLAKMWSAHLMVLHIRVDSRDIAPLAGEGLSGAMIEEMMTATEKESGSRALGLHELFGLATEDQHVTVGNAMRGRNEPSASFTVVEGREDEIIAHQARLADLTIVPHPQAGEDVASADALHAVLFDSGRPVLMAPVTKPTSIEFPTVNRLVGAGLLAAAADFRADLMSMGAYSTSRLRQLILGGTTRHVLENAVLPVLLNR